MVKIRQYFIKDPLFILLLAFPLAIMAELAHWGELWVFAISALGVIPMAGFIGRSTEALAARTGPKIGGLLNATLGNAAELIIALVAVKAGLLELVKASLTGSILGNLLLVMGMALVTGGLKNGIQSFDRRQAGNHAVLLTLSILAMTVPSLSVIRSVRLAVSRWKNSAWVWRCDDCFVYHRFDIQPAGFTRSDFIPG